MLGILLLRRCDYLLWNIIPITFNCDRFRLSNNINCITATIWEASVLVLLIEGIDSGGMKFVQSFIKMGSGIQKLYRHTDSWGDLINLRLFSSK
jgi:hypothetical protein